MTQFSDDYFISENKQTFLLAFDLIYWQNWLKIENLSISDTNENESYRIKNWLLSVVLIIKKLIIDQLFESMQSFFVNVYEKIKSMLCERRNSAPMINPFAVMQRTDLVVRKQSPEEIKHNASKLLD